MRPELYTRVILPLLIFFARICDVSMETIRVIYISRGIKYLAPLIAFFEIVIWLPAMEVVMKDLSNIANFMAFALGFGMGTYAGLVIEERLSIGMVILRIITTEESEGQITSFLAQENCGVTRLDAQGSRGNVKMIISLVNRTDVPRITDYIRTVNSCILFSKRRAVRERGRVPPEGTWRPYRNVQLGPAPEKKEIIFPSTVPRCRIPVRYIAICDRLHMLPVRMAPLPDIPRAFSAMKERENLPYCKTIIKRKTNEHSFRGIFHDFENPGNSTQQAGQP